jgi:hypothetical protein
MKRILTQALGGLTAVFLLTTALAGCGTNLGATTPVTVSTSTTSTAATTNNAAISVTGVETTEWFSSRDLEQTVDLAEATVIQLENGRDVTLSQEGIYLIRGEIQNGTIVVDAAADAKIQIVLDGVSITNDDSPAIYVKAADKVFITTTDSQDSLEVTGSFAADGDTKLDAAIFARSDLTLNGTGSLKIVSAEGNGISAKDDLVITGGTYDIQSAADALEANDAIRIHAGTLTLKAGQDGLHSENNEDAALGYIIMENGILTITAADDAIHANRSVQIDGGTIQVESCTEGIEANLITINEGQISIYATDDGINAAQKVSPDVAIVVNGGTIAVRMDSGDTDAFDSNGTITINGGTITIEARSAFDADGAAVLKGGNVTVNGQTITEITQSGPGGPGGAGGGGRIRP